jgi:hypothetical protein
MSLNPFPIAAFGGLNLFVDPIEVGAKGATDLLNVDLSVPGKLKTRDGYTKVSASAASGGPKFLVPWDGKGVAPAGHLLVAIGLSDVNDFEQNGTRTNIGGYTTYTNVTRPVIFTDGSSTPTVFWATNQGATGSTAYFYNGTILGTTTGSGGGKPQYVAASPVRGVGGLAPRLVQAGFVTAADAPSGANGTPSTVFFSDPGAPFTWTATNYIKLDPDDGEAITGVVAWNGSLFVFKNSKAFEIFSETVQQGGTPDFNYRRITLPDPIPVTDSPTSWQPVAVGPDGVYYTGTRGLWRITTGAQRVPTPIDPILAGTAGSTFSVGTVGQVRMDWAGPTLFIVYALGSGSQRVLAWDTRTGQWIIHSYAQTLSSVPVFAPTTGTAFWFAGTDGNVYKSSSAATDDNGTAITWSWKSGKYPLDAAGRVAITQESGLFGTGTVTLTLSTDSFADQSGSVTLGTAPTPAEGWLQKDQEGRYWQHTLSGSGQATVESLTHQVSFVKPVGIE